MCMFVGTCVCMCVSVCAVCACICSCVCGCVCTVCLYVGESMHAYIYNVLFVIHSCFMGCVMMTKPAF